jgi:hypothetical protein
MLWPQAASAARPGAATAPAATAHGKPMAPGCPGGTRCALDNPAGRRLRIWTEQVGEVALVDLGVVAQPVAATTWGRLGLRGPARIRGVVAGYRDTALRISGIPSIRRCAPTQNQHNPCRRRRSTQGQHGRNSIPRHQTARLLKWQSRPLTSLYAGDGAGRLHRSALLGPGQTFL